MQDTLGDGLIELLYCDPVGLGGRSCVAGLNAPAELLQGSLEIGLDDLILKGLLLYYQNALLSRLDVRQTIHLLAIQIYSYAWYFNIIAPKMQDVFKGF